MKAKIELFDSEMNGLYSKTGNLEEIILEENETIEDVLKKVKE